MTTGVYMQSWDHKEHNIQVELDKHLTIHKWGEDYLKIKLPKDKTNHRFYPIKKSTPKPLKAIRFLKIGAVPPERIGSIHELNRYIEEPADKLTVNYHYPDRLSIMYYGHYHREDYLDASKIDIPEVRVSPESGIADPMIMNSSIKGIDVHYVPGRDDASKIHEFMSKAVTNYLSKRNIKVKSKGMKLYWNDKGEWVKFYSGAPLGGHYYFYINLGIDYKSIGKYFREASKSKDKLAYGLPNIPDSMIDEVIKDFSNLYGLPLEEASYTTEEEAKLADLDKLHLDRTWIETGVRSYPRKPINIDGFEHEFDLVSKPNNNVFKFELEHSGLEFFYQPQLTRDEVAKGKNRADHIVGSYAVYHKTKANNKYQTGKFAHIYRPLVSDVTGKEVFADLNIENNIMSITIPQKFLDSAKYPVTVDPLFGYSTAGASSYSASTTDSYTALIAEPGLNGTITSLNVYAEVLVGAAPLDLVLTLYSFSDDILRDYTTQQSFNANTGPLWLSYPTTQNYLASSSINYNIGLEGYIATTSSYNAFNIYYDTATSSGATSTSNTYSSPPPSNQPAYSVVNDKFSFFASVYIPTVTKGNFLQFM